MSTRKLHVSPDLSLPLDAVTWTFAILARKRVGKTYLASVMAEEMVKASLPFVAFDPTGAWWGLRAAADGVGPGLPVVIIGGDHGDLPLEPGAGKVIADLVVDRPGYYVLDFSLTDSDAQQLRFGAEFFSRLYRRKGSVKHRDPVHLFVDEADVWAPQRPASNDENMSLHHLRTLVRRGGLRGVGVTLITQRSAELSKGVLTQAEVLLALQTTASHDIDAVETWIRRYGSDQEREAVLASLPMLQKGDAWIWHPTGDIKLRRVRARERETYNSSATPEVGARRREPRQLAAVDLEALRGQIAATIEKAKAEDPRLLRDQIAQLQRELAQEKKKGSPAPAPATKQKVVTIDRPVITRAQVASLKDGATKIADAAKELRYAVDWLDNQVIRPVLSVLEAPFKGSVKLTLVEKPGRHVDALAGQAAGKPGAKMPEVRASGRAVVVAPSLRQPRTTGLSPRESGAASLPSRSIPMGSLGSS